MADIIPFSTARSRKKQASSVSSKKMTAKKSHTFADDAGMKPSGNTLCKSGFHKWQVDKSTDFAVKRGKLLTRYHCERCGKIKNDKV